MRPLRRVTGRVRPRRPGRALPAVATTSEARYTLAARRAAQTFQRTYSTSFTLASLLFPTEVRRDIAALYTGLRCADEIVDGLDYPAPAARAQDLTELHRQSLAAAAGRISPHPFIHAFGETCYRAGITADLIDTFFRSMRRDLRPEPHTEASLAEYIDGSAEVVGVMCLRIFVAQHAATYHGSRPRGRCRRGSGCPWRQASPEAELGARHLGAALQRINFLRDLAEDVTLLRRRYLQVSSAEDAAGFAREVARARLELERGRSALGLIPPECRRAVRAATVLYGEVLDRIERAGVDGTFRHRAHVPVGRKAVIVVGAWLR